MLRAKRITPDGWIRCNTANSASSSEVPGIPTTSGRGSVFTFHSPLEVDEQIEGLQRGQVVDFEPAEAFDDLFRRRPEEVHLLSS